MGTAEAGRTVRIARRQVASEGTGTSEFLDTRPPAPAVGNRAGLRRARRLRLLYLGALAVTYLAVILMMATSPYVGVRTDVAVYALLSVIGAISAMVGYALTIGRAPWAVYVDERTLVVRERFGGVRRFPIDGTLEIRVIGRHGRGWLSPEATETVRLSSGSRPTREYVIGAGIFEGFSELSGLVRAD